MSDARSNARVLAARSLARGDAVGWFEELYTRAAGDPAHVPWADLVPNPHLLAWLDRAPLPRPGGAALVVGVGLGDDAEAIARAGLAVTAFDVSPTAIAWARERFPASKVRYETADLLAPPAAWREAFDLVFEAYTLQSLPDEVRPRATAAVAGFVAQGGTLLVVARRREETETMGGPPWPLAKSDLFPLVEQGLTASSFEELVDDDPPVRRLRAVYTRL